MVRIVDGIPVWGDPDPRSVEQIKRERTGEGKDADS
jgi:hypothetical protein